MVDFHRLNHIKHVLETDFDVKRDLEVESEAREGQGATMKFRKKPVVIEAIRYTVGSEADDYGQFNTDEVIAFGGGAIRRRTEDVRLVVSTLEGDMLASVGDWIIRGVKGEYYPCKPDIFEATYEPVEEAS